MNELLQLLSLADSNKSQLDLANQGAKIENIVTVLQAQDQQIRILKVQMASLEFTNHVLLGIMLLLFVGLGVLVVVQWWRSERDAKRIKALEMELVTVK